MKIDEELIKKVAKNARLSLTNSEIKKFTEDFKNILKTFKTLNELDTSNTKSSFQPIPLDENWREDIVKPCLSQETALKNACHKKDGYFKGPKAI